MIIGANEFQNPLILKAKEKGFETHVFAWKDGSIGEQSADYFYPISIVEKEKIYDKCKSIQPDAVVSIASDLAVITVNYVAEKLGLLCNGTKTSVYTTNKYEMRKKMYENGLPVPNFYVAGTMEDIKGVSITFPIIVKPTDRSGSRGVSKVVNEAELEQAIQCATSYSFEKKAILEDYITGQEYSCESISYRGVHHLLAVTKKFTTGAPNFIEIGHLQPSGLSKDIFKEVERIVKKALDALNITNGASHTELKIDKLGNLNIIEVGARMGGDCIGSDLVYLSTGYDFLEMVIDVGIGKEPKRIQKGECNYAGIRFLFNREDIKQIQMNCKKFPNHIVRNYIESEKDCNVVDSSTRLGYCLYSAHNIYDIMGLLDL